MRKNETLKERKRLKDKVVAKAREWALRILFRATAILIDSYASGDFNLWSDIDIILTWDISYRVAEVSRNSSTLQFSYRKKNSRHK